MKESRAGHVLLGLRLSSATLWKTYILVMCATLNATSHIIFWTVPGYKSPRVSKSLPRVTRNNIAQKWCPAARQGPIYKPTRSKLNPKCSYNSTGAFWWAYHPMLLLVGFQRINRPGNHITGRWLSSLGECTRRMMWGRSNCDTGGYVEFPPTPPCCGWGVGHWTLSLTWQGGVLTMFSSTPPPTLLTVNASQCLL